MEDEQINKLIKQCEIYIEKPKEMPGGQSCGMITYPTVIYHADLNIKISVGYHRANYKNRQLAIELFELALLGIK